MPRSAISSFLAGLWESLRSRRSARGRTRAASPGRAGSPLARVAILLALLLAALLAAAAVFSWATRPVLEGAFRAADEFSPPRSLGAAPDELAADLERVLAIAPGATPRQWNSIVFHHSATVGGSAESFDAYHRAQKGWDSLGYDFVIGNGNGTADGAIQTGPRWRRQLPGAHANSAEFNEHGIGICLVGNFDLWPPTPAQLRAARLLARELARRYTISRRRILGHKDIREGGGTACPGRYFPMDRILEDW